MLLPITTVVMPHAVSSRVKPPTLSETAATARGELGVVMSIICTPLSLVAATKA